MDELDIYDDLDEFHEQEEKKSKELLALEAKYEEALKTIEAMKLEKKDLRKKIRLMEQNLQSLLDTAKAEVKRKDKIIDELRKEKDDLCFRRQRLPQKARNEQWNAVDPATGIRNFNKFKNVDSNVCDTAQRNVHRPAKIETIEATPSGSLALKKDSAGEDVISPSDGEPKGSIPQKTCDTIKEKPKESTIKSPPVVEIQDNSSDSVQKQDRDDKELKAEKREPKKRDKQGDSSENVSKLSRRQSTDRSRGKSRERSQGKSRDRSRGGTRNTSRGRSRDRSNTSRYDGKRHSHRQIDSKEKEKSNRYNSDDHSSYRSHKNERRDRSRSSDRYDKSERKQRHVEDPPNNLSRNGKRSSHAAREEEKTRDKKYNSHAGKDDSLIHAKESDKSRKRRRSSNSEEEGHKKRAHLWKESRGEKSDDNKNQSLTKTLELENIGSSDDDFDIESNLISRLEKNLPIEHTEPGKESGNENELAEKDSKENSDRHDIESSSKLEQQFKSKEKVMCMQAVLEMNETVALEKAKVIPEAASYVSSTDTVLKDLHQAQLDIEKPVELKDFKQVSPNGFDFSKQRENDEKHTYTKIQPAMSLKETDTACKEVVSDNTKIEFQSAAANNSKSLNKTEKIVIEKSNIETASTVVKNRTAKENNSESDTLVVKKSIEAVDTPDKLSLFDALFGDTTFNRNTITTTNETIPAVDAETLYDSSHSTSTDLYTDFFETPSKNSPKSPKTIADKDEDLNKTEILNHCFPLDQNVVPIPGLVYSETNCRDLKGIESRTKSFCAKGEMETSKMISEKCDTPAFIAIEKVNESNTESEDKISVYSLEIRNKSESEIPLIVAENSPESRTNDELRAKTCASDSNDFSNLSELQSVERISESENVDKNTLNIVPSTKPLENSSNELNACSNDSTNTKINTMTHKEIKEINEQCSRLKTASKRQLHQMRVDEDEDSEKTTNEVRNLETVEKTNKEFKEHEETIESTVGKLVLESDDDFETMSLPEKGSYNSKILTSNECVIGDSNPIQAAAPILLDSVTMISDEGDNVESQRSILTYEASISVERKDEIEKDVEKLNHISAVNETINSNTAIETIGGQKIIHSPQKTSNDFQDPLNAKNSVVSQHKEKENSGELSIEIENAEEISVNAQSSSAVSINDKNSVVKRLAIDEEYSFFNLTISSDEDEVTTSMEAKAVGEQRKQKIQIIENIRLPALFQSIKCAEDKPTPKKQLHLNADEEKCTEKNGPIENGTKTDTIVGNEKRVENNESVILIDITEDSIVGKQENKKNGLHEKHESKIEQEIIKDAFETKIISMDTDEKDSKSLKEIQSQEIVRKESEEVLVQLEANLNLSTDTSLSIESLKITTNNRKAIKQNIEPSTSNQSVPKTTKAKQKIANQKSKTPLKKTATQKSKSFIKLDVVKCGKDKEKRRLTEHNGKIKDNEKQKQRDSLQEILSENIQDVTTPSKKQVKKPLLSPKSPYKKTPTGKQFKTKEVRVRIPRIVKKRPVESKDTASKSCNGDSPIRKQCSPVPLNVTNASKMKTQNLSTSAELRAMLIDGKSPKINNDMIVTSPVSAVQDELDKDMHAIFNSPAKFDTSLPLNDTVPCGNSTVLSTTINESLTCSNLESSRVPENLNKTNDSSFESKRLSLGTTQYVYERVSEDVVNLFITRKRSKKRAQLGT